MEDRGQKIAEYLQGTGNTLQDACRELFDIDEEELTEDEHLEISMEVFLCDTCGWWFERVEEAEEDGAGNCESCWDSQNE